jgi:hypothetical protein
MSVGEIAMPTKRLFLALAAAAALIVGIANRAAAQPSRFTNDTLDVFDAQQLFSESNGHDFRSGAPILLTVDRGSSYANQRQTRRMYARIFTLRRGDNFPRPWAFFDPCYVFYSVVLNARFGNGRLNLGSWAGLNFLSVENGVVSSGRYLIVLEEQAESGRLIRINRNDVSRYFSRGLYIEVVPTRAYNASEIARHSAGLNQRASEVLAAAQTNSPTYRCYRYRQAQNEGREDVRFTSLEECLDSLSS